MARIALETGRGVVKESAREEILARLRQAPKMEIPARPVMPTPREVLLDRDGLTARFTEELTRESGVVYRAADREEILDYLTEIARAESLTRIMMSTDDMIRSLDLPAWGERQGVSVSTAADYPDRESYTRAVFDETDAGVTGADFAVAETGTLVIAHGGNQPRLVSLAPVLHVAVVGIDRLVPTYEDALSVFYGDAGLIPPAHLTLVTGPSMTADIRATAFKGMHGPRRVIVILAG
jgi:L-lactate dehydrogenase complex protein LldG